MLCYSCLPSHPPSCMFPERVWRVWLTVCCCTVAHLDSSSMHSYIHLVFILLQCHMWTFCVFFCTACELSDQPALQTLWAINTSQCQFFHTISHCLSYCLPGLHCHHLAPYHQQIKLNSHFSLESLHLNPTKDTSHNISLILLQSLLCYLQLIPHPLHPLFLCSVDIIHKFHSIIHEVIEPSSHNICFLCESCSLHKNEHTHTKTYTEREEEQGELRRASNNLSYKFTLCFPFHYHYLIC